MRETANRVVAKVISGIAVPKSQESKQIMQNEQNIIPDFNNEEQEREFWAKHDSSDFIDWEKAESIVLPKLKHKLLEQEINLKK